MSQLSYEQVVSAYTSTVYGVALTHTARRADADDVFQEVFFAYWKSQPVFNSEEHRKAWLIRTTLNFCLKSTQSSWARKTIYAEEDWQELDLADTLPEDSEDFDFQNQEQTDLYHALRRLPQASRTVVQLFYFEELSIAEIAETLGEKQGAIKTRLSRARAQLREIIQGKAGVNADGR